MTERRQNLLLILILAVLLLTVATLQLRRSYVAPGPLRADTLVRIPPGYSLRSISELLEDRGVVAGARYFEIVARLRGANRVIRAGEYPIEAHESLQRIIQRLQTGMLYLRRFTVAEGLNSRQVVALLNEVETLTGSLEEIPPEGSLLPETYFYHFGDSRQEIVGRMQQAMDEMKAEVWALRNPGLPLRNLDEVIILASIVEKETAVAKERPMVARVFLNRLAKGMRLQSDPTVIYGLSVEHPLNRPLSRGDLGTPTPFNTYLIDRLPPGPIANPGAASLISVVRPADSSALYFVADGSGGHIFAETLREHLNNVRKWRNIEHSGRR